jgi:hypothetical protein
MRPLVPLAALAICALPLAAQTPCAGTPTYSPCDMVFDMSDQDLAAHPNPYATVELAGEFRSPRFRTLRMPGFWDGARRLVIRFTPVEPGNWTFRLTSNLASIQGKSGSFQAVESNSPGFVRARNVHHFAYTEGDRPHLWMGDTLYRLAFIDEALFRQVIDKRAEQKFNHVRGGVIGFEEEAAKVFATPDRPDPAHFQRLDERVRYMNGKGIVADLILAGDENHLAKLFPSWQQRERYVKYLIARYAPLNITWQGVQEFEEYADGKALMKEVGALLKQHDPYNHLRSTHAVTTSAPLLEDGWMDYVVYQSSSDALGAIEHQLYETPFVNTEFAYEDSGAGRTHPHHVDSDTFRRRLWNAAMNGQYVTFGNTGTYTGKKLGMDPKYLDSPGAKYMTHWFEFFEKTRHWELEPYFDVDGGRALALEGTEYIVYVEKPGPVEILVEKHGYDVAWFNPISGERVAVKDFKSDKFTAEPPTKDHDWVLHISREGRKEGMLRSYKFDSRRIYMQEVERNPTKVPYVIEQPAGETLAVNKPAPYAAKVTRETRATRSMYWLWTGEVARDGQGYRVLATGPKGELQIPKRIVKQLPAVLHLRLYGINANGKLYQLDRTYQLAP